MGSAKFLSPQPDRGTTKIVVLTRPAGQSAALAAQLEDSGWQVFDWPALALIGAAAIDVPQPEHYDIVMFVSGNAVRFYAAQLARSSRDWPLGVTVATVGPASARAVVEHFGSQINIVQPALDSAAFDSEALWRELSQRSLLDRRVLIVRGGEGRAGHGRPWLAERLTAAGAQVTLYAAYRRQPAVWPAERSEQLAAWRAAGMHPVWFVSSGEGVHALATSLGACAIAQAWAGCRVIVPHERVARKITDLASSCGIATARVEEGAGTTDPDSIMLKLCMPHDPAVLDAIVN